MNRSAPGRGFAGRICVRLLCARLALAAVLLVSLAGLVSIERLFAPRAELWPRWQAHDPGSAETVDHAVWQRILGAYLAPGADREHPLRMWGAMEGHVPALQRWVLRLGYPVFKALMRKAFNLDDTAAHQKRYAIIQSMFDDVDAALEASGGKHIMGPHLSYVDISFCALMGPLMPSTVLPLWANGRFESFKPLVDSTFPDELTKLEQELRARPCGRYVEEMFSQWRHRSFDDRSAGPAPAPERDLASP